MVNEKDMAETMKVRDEMVKFQEMQIYEGMTLFELSDKLLRMKELQDEFDKQFQKIHKQIQKEKKKKQQEKINNTTKIKEKII